MCRMCLVEVGRPQIDRATGEPLRNEDGSPKIQFNPKLETACTTPVSEGMVVLGASKAVKAGRDDILEFLLTSHPLDCPVCDKGGECPLQNLTMRYGPGESRFRFEEKMHLAKMVPLGELILLDRERCIFCARCVRFQDEIADDPVLAFTQRGRAMQIVSHSEPGFDSYFSGNTTDICPVGALTTADFRFGARPWELSAAASICQHCPVGCNTTLNTRREGASGGGWVIKRVMPRQNESVNEIWLCDKGRMAYQYTESEQRLTQPLVRKDGALTPVEWDEALELVASHFRQAGEGLLTLAGGRLSNEDLFNLRQLSLGLGGKTALYTHMAGGDLVSQLGVGQGANFADMGAGSAILVVASDLEEEAPIWWLRVKQAAERGATLIVANPRPTKTDRYAAYTLRYPYGSEAAVVLAMLNALSAKRPNLPASVQALARYPELQAAAKAFAEAKDAVVFYGSEGIGLAGSQALAQACANLLLATNHTGQANNGLIGVWSRANEQGAWELGYRPAPDLKSAMRSAKALYVVAADPAGDDPDLAEATDFLVVQDLFLTDTARLADVVLPALPFTEREGSLTSGERRVQRYYPAIPPRKAALADFVIAGRLGRLLGLELEERLAARAFDQLAAHTPAYSGLSYARLAEVVEQWPLVGRSSLYYGGATYENRQGLGVQLAPVATDGEKATLTWPELPGTLEPGDGLVAVPVTRLYDRGQTVVPSQLLHQRIGPTRVYLNPVDAQRMGIDEGDSVQVLFDGIASTVVARLDERAPAGHILAPRSMGIPVASPQRVRLQVTEKSAA